YLGLLDKAQEIYFELGDRAVLSYIRSSHRLLSKVYHPDLNPKNKEKAKITQQRLNRLSRLLSRAFELQELFRDILLIEGYDVRVAEDGVKGYDMYCQFKPDLIFTDVVMPKMSGLELVRKIREVTPRIKVVYISGFFGLEPLKRELDREILRHGYCALSKPFKISEMLDLVSSYLQNFEDGSSGINIYA
ncbi:MAG: response regulator, partial [Deltaproteobacteria bacterium]|nr:response regulator [Deltaproteobacteria bacterium]